MTTKLPRRCLTTTQARYLRAAHQVCLERSVARVRDIAAACDVRASSVTPAMKRLAELGYVNYERREYITLTPIGEKKAVSLLARGALLIRVMTAVMGLPPDLAQCNVADWELTVDDDALEHFARRLEYMEVCPQGRARPRGQYGSCLRIHEHLETCPVCCDDGNSDESAPVDERPLTALVDGESGRVCQIAAPPAARNDVLNQGVLPGFEVSVVKASVSGDAVTLALPWHDVHVTLPHNHARAVLVGGSMSPHRG